MRTILVLLALGATACGGDAGDDKTGSDPTGTDTDTDPTVDTDDGDGGGDAVRVWDTVEPVARYQTTTFDGVDVIAYAPDPLRGMVVMLHGTGGGASWVEGPEVTAVLNELITGGVGFVSISSDDRRSGQFDTQTTRGSNVDYQRLSALRDLYLAEGEISEDTPFFTLGYSAGGGFAAYVAHAGLQDGWPIAGVSLHQSTGYNPIYGAPPTEVPVLFFPAEHDETVDPGIVQQRFDELIADGGTGELRLHREDRLEPTRFARSPHLTQRQSRALFDDAVARGFFDAQGQRLFPDDQIAASIDAFVAEVPYPPPTRAVLSVVLATHAFNGQYADLEARYLLDLLP